MLSGGRMEPVCLEALRRLLAPQGGRGCCLVGHDVEPTHPGHEMRRIRFGVNRGHAARLRGVEAERRWR